MTGATGVTGVETPDAISSRVSMWNADWRSTSTSYCLPFMVTIYFITLASSCDAADCTGINVFENDLL